VRAQAVVVTGKIVWECCRDRFVCFLFSFPFPGGGDVVALASTATPHWIAHDAAGRCADGGMHLCACVQPPLHTGDFFFAPGPAAVAFNIKRIFFFFLSIPSTFQPVIVARYYSVVTAESLTISPYKRRAFTVKGEARRRHQKGLRDDRVRYFYFFYFSFTRPKNTVGIAAIASHYTGCDEGALAAEGSAPNRFHVRFA